MPILNPFEEEKHSEPAGSGSTTTDEANERLSRLTHQVELHMETLLEASGYSDSIKSSFESMPSCIQDLIGYKVWESFGKIEGIHNDFGRHSYLHLSG